MNTSLHLVCLNGQDDFIYRAELEAWGRAFPALTVRYWATKTQGRLNAKQLAILAPDLLEQDVFIAGPPAMVSRTVELAHALGVLPRQIQTDVFDGY